MGKAGGERSVGEATDWAAEGREYGSLDTWFRIRCSKITRT
jgi:hypothetical protein